MSFLNWVETLSPIVGAGAGFMLGGPQGAMIGSAAGSALAGGLSLLEQPNVPSVPGQLKAQYANSAYLASRLMAGGGLDESTYFRMRENAKQRALTQVGEIMGLARDMALTPLQLDALAKEVLRTKTSMAQETARIENLDTEQIMSNLKAAVSANAQANQVAAQITQTQMQIERMRQQIEQQKAAAWAKILGGLAQAGMVYAEMTKNNPSNKAKPTGNEIFGEGKEAADKFDAYQKTPLKDYDEQKAADLLLELVNKTSMPT